MSGIDAGTTPTTYYLHLLNIYKFWKDFFFNSLSRCELCEYEYECNFQLPDAEFPLSAAYITSCGQPSTKIPILPKNIYQHFCQAARAGRQHTYGNDVRALGFW